MGAEQKRFVSHYIKLDFGNNTNLKTDIQNRIGEETESNFLKALNNIQGNCKERNGEDFSEVVRQALAYFYTAIFPTDKYTYKDSYWTLSAVKGFFDACNLTSYTAIDEIVSTYYPLKKKALFNHCYLIIQTAHFFNSDNFGAHQYLTYTAEYTRNGIKLPIEDYKYDKGHLNVSYERLDERKKKGTLPNGIIEFYYVDQWYYSVLNLVVTELGLSKKNFRANYKKSREFNITVLTPRILRWETPFVLTHIDISSAYPSFLDAITGSNIAPDIYERVAKATNKTRSKAKVHFLKIINSGKYYHWRKEVAIRDLISWGYTKEQAEHVTKFTHDPNKSFTEHMSEIEEECIHTFARVNAVEKYVRLHDALLYIDTKKPNKEFNFEGNTIRFESEMPKKPNINTSFKMSKRWLPYGYVSSVPYFKNLVRRTIPSDKDLKGSAEGFSFFYDKFEYHSASFNLNDEYDLQAFIGECTEMFNTIYYLNGRKASKLEIESIVRHIRRNSNICFQLRNMYRILTELNEKSISVSHEREKDWEATKRRSFKTKLDFLKALNSARKKVNQIYLIRIIKVVLSEALETDEKGWIEFGLPRQNQSYKLAYAIASNINYLRTERKRKPRPQSCNYEPLYTYYYKEPRSYRIEVKKNNRINPAILLKRRLKAHNKEFQKLKQLEESRKLSEQYIFILNEIVNEETEFAINRDEEFIQAEKEKIAKALGVEKFRDLILIKPESEINPKEATEDIFNTDLSNSMFNQITMQEAIDKGILEEFEAFHNQNETLSQESNKRPSTLKKVTKIESLDNG